MSETTDTEEEVKDLTEEQEVQVREALETLKNWQQNVFITAMANGIQEKHDDMLSGQGNGTVKNNAYNKGYMQALRDIYKSIRLLLDAEGFQNVREQAIAESASATEGSTGEGNDAGPGAEAVDIRAGEFQSEAIDGSDQHATTD